MRITVCFVVVALTFVLLSAPLYAQQEQQPRFRTNQYKRIHQDALKMIESGKVDQAVTFLEAHAKQFPEDGETQFMLTLAYAQAGRKDKAVAAMGKAVDLGLPPGRFAAGPRELTKPIAESEALKKLVADTRLVHGPMVGKLTGTSATLWVRLSVEAPVFVSLKELNGPPLEVKSGKANVKADNDYTAEIRVDGLKPRTAYTYTVYFGEPDNSVAPLATGRVTTAAKTGEAAKFTLAFGGGAGYVPQHEHMWTTIHKQKPDMLVLLGDNVYIDQPESTYMQRYCYYRRFSRPEFRKLVAETPVYTIWDDHDFSTNDSWGGPEIDEPKWKPTVWKIYKENWVNPGYGGGEKQPGCWYAFSRGDVDFIMLDGRYYRTNPRVENPSMLGPVQLEWLFDTLKKSKGTFKVICSPVPMTFRAKGDSKDTWNGFRDERKKIFDFLTANKIEGVVLMSADRHRSDLWKIERPNDYALYEFNSSRLTNQHVHGEMKQAEFSYNKKQSFGLVDFDTTKDDPTVTYRIMSIDGEQVFERELKRGSLK